MTVLEEGMAEGTMWPCPAGVHQLAFGAMNQDNRITIAMAKPKKRSGVG